MSALEKPLDGAGLAVVNQIINERLNKKQDALTAGDGTSISGDAINVITPVRGAFTQAEYDALPEAKKSSGMYIISDGNDASIPPGGTTGQALVKTGADDYATGWKTLTAADVGATTAEESDSKYLKLTGGTLNGPMWIVQASADGSIILKSPDGIARTVIRAGGIVTDQVSIAQHPVNPLDCATKKYVDDSVSSVTAEDVGAATMEQVNAAINAAITGAMEASY